jgi:hypothetical protein
MLTFCPATCAWAGYGDDVKAAARKSVAANPCRRKPADARAWATLIVVLLSEAGLDWHGRPGFEPNEITFRKQSFSVLDF